MVGSASPELDTRVVHPGCVTVLTYGVATLVITYELFAAAPKFYAGITATAMAFD
jgi:hypothetical protein